MMMEKCYSAPVKPIGAKRALFISDLHTLHPRVHTTYVVDSDEEVIRAYLSTVDVIYFTGDFWDDSRHTRQDIVHYVIEHISLILRLAKENDIGIRVLNGTPSHDYGQSKMFMSLNVGIGADVKYLDGIGIFYDERLGMNVGWVEDEYKKNIAVETEREFKNLLRESGLRSVGLMVMHGCFKFQLPIDSATTFSESFWQSITDHLIVIGHDHREKLFGIIRVPGSLERLSHNEEEDKGATVADFIDGVTKLYFHVNQRACLQITVPINDSYLEQKAETLRQIERILQHPSKHVARLRIIAKEDSPIFEDFKKWKKDLSFHIQIEKEITSAKKKKIRESFKNVEVLEEITKDNIDDLLIAEGKPSKDIIETIRHISGGIK